MAHGHPDYGRSGPLSTVHRVDDMGELAARLASIDTFDRRGNVVWMDDFENNLKKWLVTLTGTGADIVLSVNAARNGGASAKITTGNAAGNTEHLAHYGSYPILSKVGFEIAVTLNVNVSFVEVLVGAEDGTLLKYGAVRYLPNSSRLDLYNSSGAWVTIASSLSPYFSDYAFHPLKLVIDLATGKYVRVLFAGQSWDLSAYDLYSTAFLVHNFLWVNISTASQAAASASIYVDDAIITQNEP